MLAMLMQRIAGLEQMLRQGGAQRPTASSAGEKERVEDEEPRLPSGAPPTQERPDDVRRGIIAASYQRYLGGPPSPQELAGYLSMTPQQIIAAVANSQESRNFAASGRTARTPEWAKANGVSTAPPPGQQGQQKGQGAPVYDTRTDPNAGTRFEGASGFNPNGTLRLAANDPDAAALMAKYPGRYEMGTSAGAALAPPPPPPTYTPPVGGPAVTTSGVPGAKTDVTVPTSQFAGGILPPWFADAMAGQSASVGAAPPPPPDARVYSRPYPDPDDEEE